MRLLIITQAVDENNPVLGFFLNWIKEFAKHCQSIIVICLYEGQYNLPANVKVLSLGKEDGVSRIKYLFRFYKFIWQERKNYDAVFVHMNQIYVILGGLLWKMWQKRIGFWYVHKKISSSLYIAEKLADDIFTASNKSFRLPSKKIKIVGHGIDVNKFIPLNNKPDNGKFKIITVGRISPSKDYETLIEAVEMILKDDERENIEVNVIGEPGTISQNEYFENLKKLVVEKKLESVVHFLGPIANKNIVPFLQEADLFINTSHTGSLDKAVLEAMACETLVVTANEAFTEILGDLQSTLMVNKRDAKMLAEKIRFFLSPENKKEIIKKRLREIIVNDHDLNVLIAKIIFEYKNI